jgi:hypothetical protein
MFRLLYEDGSTSTQADSIQAALKLYVGVQKAWLQQRRDGWFTISNDVNGREGEVVVTVGDVSSNSSAAQTLQPDASSTARSQVASVDQNGVVSYDTVELNAWSPMNLGAKLGGWWQGSLTPRIGGAILTSGSLPTASTHKGRPTLAFAKASSQYAVGTFARAQTTESWCAARFVGAVGAANEVMFSGIGT